MEHFQLAEIIRWVNEPLFHIGSTPVTFGGIGSAFVVMLCALMISSVIQRAVSSNLTKSLNLTSGMTYALRRILHYLIVFLGVLLAAQCVGLNLGSLAVIFGFLSVGIGFGLQNITSNFIAGLIILLEQPISVGDFISVEDQMGTVTDIKMRSTYIQTLDCVTIIIPNSKFVEGQVTNWSHGDTRVRIHCPVGVAYGSDTELVTKTLLEAAAGLNGVLKNPAPEVRFMGFGDSSLDFELLIWSNTPEKQFALHSQMNYAIDHAFRKHGIQIPFPQRDLHLQMTPAIERLSKA
ncbi:MAG: mechanosensitive ion channel [Candidatus Omnitrophica bacterium]|nr:mechanosensitive ion channel [Candidatus Omnitrophota bacterium]